jgi:DHA1 family tetracycline resistance protein-like MFS transporter
VSPLVIIFVTVFIDLLGFGIIIPLLPFYAESFGADAFTIGLLGTVYSLMQFLVAPLCGRWSDRIGRRPIILGGLLASAVAYVALALADSLALIFAARIVGGIAGGNIPTAQAYIADITTQENRAKGMGLVGAAFGLGFIIGPALGGILTRFGQSTPMWCAAALCFANFAAAVFLLPESRHGDRTRVSISRFDLFRRERRSQASRRPLRSLRSDGSISTRNVSAMSSRSLASYWQS